MLITDDIKEYLNGNIFSSGLKWQILKKDMVYNRIELLSDICSKKNVLHVGACDHLPLIKSKIINNVWLHKRIMECASSVLGIDINEEAVAYCKSIGYDNIENINLITQSEIAIPLLLKSSNNNGIDYAVLGEIIEHLDNPVEFLCGIKKQYNGIIEKLIITVPNVFWYGYLREAMNGYEWINTDHRYWFTPYTICKITAMAGLVPEEILFSGEVCVENGQSGIVSDNALVESNSIICIARL